MENKYQDMTIVQLRNEAKERGIKGVTAMRKAELSKLLYDIDEKMSLIRSEKAKKKEAEEKQRNTVQNTAEPNTAEPNTAESKKAESKSIESKITEKNLVNESKNEQVKHAPKHENEDEKRDENLGEGKTENTQISFDEKTENTGNTENTENTGNAEHHEGRDNNGNNDVHDSGIIKEGILEVLSEGYGFIRCDNYLPGSDDVYVSPIQIRRFNLKTGDIIVGNAKAKNQNEKFSALIYVRTVNGFAPGDAIRRPKFENLTPIFPNERIRLERPGCDVSMRMVDLISPIGKGQRGMIVSQPKAGKTTLLKQIAKSITHNYPEMNLIVLLIDERPEEVTDMKESIEGKNVEVIYSTFDEMPENHKRVSEMVIERAKRLVEHKKDVVILLDSITRLARAYNLTVSPSGRTLSGGLDPAALYMPKRFFGAARNMREGGSLTILSTALVDTGSRMDDVVFEEFKGTGNMELVLDRNLSERRIFPAIDLVKSSTRRDDLLLTPEEMQATNLMHKALNGIKSEESAERIINLFVKTKDNKQFVEIAEKTRL